MRKVLVILTLVLLFIATTMGIYYNFVYLPEKKMKERIKPLMDAGLTSEEALVFDEIYGYWAPYNETATGFARYWIDYPAVSETILKTSGSLKYTATSLDLVIPNIANKTLTQDILIDFMVKHPSFVKDDGLNATDIRLIKYYVYLPGIVDKVIEKIKSQEERLFALDELAPYISRPLTEEQAHQLIQKWYPELFKGCEEKGVPVVFGDLDEDKLNNYKEIFELGTDPLKYNTWLKFVFNITRRPSDYWGKTDTRDLAAAFDYIQFLDKNSNVVKSIEFEPGDEKYLGRGWYGLERWGDVSGSWSGNNSIVFLDIPIKAHFLKFKANSIGRTDYQDLEVGLKELMSHPNEMKIYFNDETVDKIPLYGRMQIHYVDLRPYLDSDGDGVVNKFDINPRIPNPEPIETDVNIGVYYLTGWGLKGRSADWNLGTPFSPLLGNYTSDDPDVADWHIKWAVEHGINIFICGYTKPYFAWENNLEDGLLRAKFLPYINWAIFFNNGPFWPGNPHGNDPSYLDKLTDETVSYITENYFDHPSYFEIGEKPLLILYSASLYYDIFGPEKFNLLINDIRGSASRSGYSIYLVGDVMGTWAGDDEMALTHAKEIIEPFDAISAYAILDAGEHWEYDEKGNVHLVKPYDTMVDGYIDLSKWWSNQAKKYSKKFIPPLITGFNNRIMYEKGIDNWLVIRTNPSFEEYKRVSQGIKPFIDLELNMVIAGAWNEFQEGWVIEPTEEFGYAYLKVLYDVFAKEILRVEMLPNSQTDFMIFYLDKPLVKKVLTGFHNFEWPKDDEGDDVVYLHLLIGYLSDKEWDFAEGNMDTVEVDIAKEFGRYVEWSNYVAGEKSFDFESYSRAKLTVVDKKYVVTFVKDTFIPLKNIENVVDFYVEIGRKSGGFSWTAIKNVDDNIVRKDMVYTGEERYVAHYFEEEKISRYGWIMGQTLNNKTSFVLVFKCASEIYPDNSVKELYEIIPSASDSAGRYDAIELHLEITPWWGSPQTLLANVKYNLEYYIVVGPADEGFEWIEEVIGRMDSLIETD